MAEAIKITQLYEHIELYSAGEPALNTLFVLGQDRAPSLTGSIQFSISLDEQLTQSVDELLLIDPPADAVERFKLEGNVASLFTSGQSQIGLPTIETQPGGTAHLRIGQHFVDLYSYRFGELIYLPALGLLLSGMFGSDSSLPLLAEDSDGHEELDALRQAASLVKDRQFQLMVPHLGIMESDKIRVMQRLAEDVAYIHGIRRVTESLVERGDDFESLLAISDSLLPSVRSGVAAERNHLVNLQSLYTQLG